MKSRVILAACWLAGASMGWALEIVGHRGAPQDAPENTLSSFKLAYQQQADAVELDIYLSKDNRLMVIHDPTTSRTAGGLNKTVADETAEALRQLDVGWPGRISEKIPLFEEALALIPKGKKLFVHVKVGPEFLPALRQALDRTGTSPKQLVIIGDYSTMRRAKAQYPKLQVLWLEGTGAQNRQGRPVEELIQMAKSARMDGVDLDQGFPIDKEFVRKIHKAGLKLYTWTVDDPVVARSEAQAGVDGITTDRPGWLREQLAAVPWP